MKKPLTKTQKETLDFIISFSEKKGYMPSVEDLGKHFGIAETSSAFYRLKSLADKGYIRRTSRAREIYLID